MDNWVIAQPCGMEGPYSKVSRSVPIASGIQMALLCFPKIACHTLISVLTWLPTCPTI